MPEENSIDQLLLRIRRIEEVFICLTGKPLPDLSINYDDLLKEIQVLVNGRAKLNAVKLYNDRTGCGLVGAKRRIDAIDA